MSKYGIFIIESLRDGDYLDGNTLKEILTLSEIEVIYEEVKNEQDFINAIANFRNSNFRYLHISCHADSIGIEIDGNEITNERLSDIIGNALKKKRLFMSACQGSNFDIAARSISKNKAFSLIGTPEDLRFDKSVLFWPTFYHAINELDNTKMGYSYITKTLKKCVNLLGITIDYYSFIRRDKKRIKQIKVRRGKKTTIKRLSIESVL